MERLEEKDGTIGRKGWNDGKRWHWQAWMEHRRIGLEEGGNGTMGEKRIKGQKEWKDGSMEEWKEGRYRKT
jgi:hypothetical protein